MPYHVRPDAVFPNNWISVHHSGEVILYPMATPNRWEAASDWLFVMNDGLSLVRRLERRQDLIQWLKDNFEDHKIIDLMQYEEEGKFLEGTGSIVFDYQGNLTVSKSVMFLNHSMISRKSSLCLWICQDPPWGVQRPVQTNKFRTRVTPGQWQARYR